MPVNLKQIMLTEERNEVKLYPKRGAAITKGEGVYVYDTEGKKYLDFMTNLGVSILGYTNPEITGAISKQIEAIPSVHQTFYSQARADLLKEFLEILPENLNKAVFTNSGAESIEAALKLAMAATGKTQFIAASNAYHGRTLGSLSVTGQEKYKSMFDGFLGTAIHVPYEDAQAIEKSITSKTAAVILEPIQGEAGIIIPDKKYLKEVKKICDKKGVLLILDEIQSAIRTGVWFAFERSGIVPDILCLSKSLSYGVPFGLVFTTEQVAEKMPKGGHGSTFAGNPMAAVAATEVVKKIKKKKLLKNAVEVGGYLLEGLKKIKHPAIVKVRGAGVMIAIELKENTTPYLKKMQDLGLIAASSSSDTIRFLAPVCITKKDADFALKITGEVFK
jgi:LysW-gamma-L-lysine/LysW-L-ornithine aminotransferase